MGEERTPSSSGDIRRGPSEEPLDEAGQTLAADLIDDSTGGPSPTPPAQAPFGAHADGNDEDAAADDNGTGNDEDKGAEPDQ